MQEDEGYKYSPRSIPAPAGEPCKAESLTTELKVYPRACGGTLPRSSQKKWTRGLSPRLRGNLGAGASSMGMIGSIPAPAGEPLPNAVAQRRVGVYPRACGGTSYFEAGNNSYMVYPRACGGTVHPDLPRSCPRGLSPRLRGNHYTSTLTNTGSGSIPAPAGEPVRCRCG